MKRIADVPPSTLWYFAAALFALSFLIGITLNPQPSNWAMLTLACAFVAIGASARDRR